MLSYIYLILITLIAISSAVGIIYMVTRYVQKLRRLFCYMDNILNIHRDNLVQVNKELKVLQRYIESLQNPPKTEEQIKEKYEKIRQDDAQTEDTIYEYDLEELYLREVGLFEDVIKRQAV
jgi:predicted Holliday junction resolvase-like endonuclease